LIEAAAKILAGYALIIWLGGTLHLAIATVPQIVKSIEDSGLRTRLIAGIMSRYNGVSWTALLILLASVSLLTFININNTSIILITATASLTFIVAFLDFIHSFIYGPRAARTGSPEARRKAMLIARVETLLALPIPALILML